MTNWANYPLSLKYTIIITYFQAGMKRKVYPMMLEILNMLAKIRINRVSKYDSEMARAEKIQMQYNWWLIPSSLKHSPNLQLA